MDLGLVVSIVVICFSIALPAAAALHAYFLSKKPPTPDEAFLFEMQNKLEQQKSQLQIDADEMASTLEHLAHEREMLNSERRLLSQRKKQLDEREQYLSEGAYQIFLDYVTDSVLTREYLLMTPAFLALVDPDYSNERYSRSLRDMEASIWVEEPFDISAVIRDESGRYHTTLHHCDCNFYQRFHHPCTHMIRLALEVGGAMCFAPSSESPSEVKHSKYSPWGNKVWIPIKKH